jgi:hypothetical protein
MLYVREAFSMVVMVVYCREPIDRSSSDKGQTAELRTHHPGVSQIRQPWGFTHSPFSYTNSLGGVGATLKLAAMHLGQWRYDELE